MTEAAFVKASPTQNVTVLVESPVPRELQAETAAKLLAYDGVGGEQVGFLEKPTVPGAQLRLQMMGGEFCGNATMSVGAYLAWRTGLADGDCFDYMLEVSGAPDVVECHIVRKGNAYRGTVRMPLPEKFGEVMLDTDAGTMKVPVVYMPGIVHMIVPMNERLSRPEIERRIRSWNDEIHADALGVIRYDESTQNIEPIVYVPATDSAVWERGCGSGTAALGSWKAWSTGGSFRGAICQPGGEITVQADGSAGEIYDLKITGTVRIMASGTAYLE